VDKNHFTILIPSFNASPWLEENLKSVFYQNYNNFDIYYINDYSTDDTKSKVENYFNNLKFNGNKKTLIHNNFNKGKMNNLFYSIKNLREDTIIIILDGDDWLADLNVLKYLDDVYDEDTWMTNGSYRINPTEEIVRPKIDLNYWSGPIRKQSWEFSHLGTFRKKLFDKIKKKDLMNKDGVFYQTTSDQAIMWPMAELCGREHHKVIDKILYIYNRENPHADDLVHRVDQINTEKEIRNKNSYQQLASL
jgi:glycosyltransferase involved in cell wall biosynthesis